MNTIQESLPPGESVIPRSALPEAAASGMWVRFMDILESRHQYFWDLGGIGEYTNDWYLDPINNECTPADFLWSRVLDNAKAIGDIGLRLRVLKWQLLRGSMMFTNTELLLEELRQFEPETAAHVSEAMHHEDHAQQAFYSRHLPGGGVWLEAESALKTSIRHWKAAGADFRAGREAAMLNLFATYARQNKREESAHLAGEMLNSWEKHGFCCIFDNPWVYRKLPQRREWTCCIGTSPDGAAQRLDFINTLRKISILLMSIGAWEQAVRYLQKIRTLITTLSSTHLDMACRVSVHSYRGCFKQSHSALWGGLGVFTGPRLGVVCFELGQALQHLGHQEEAETSIEEGIGFLRHETGGSELPRALLAAARLAATREAWSVALERVTEAINCSSPESSECDSLAQSVLLSLCTHELGDQEIAEMKELAAAWTLAANERKA